MRGATPLRCIQDCEGKVVCGFELLHVEEPKKTHFGVRVDHMVPESILENFCRNLCVYFCLSVCPD